jgi:hypothetical protein
VEATLFATLMSVLNGGAFCGSALGSGLTAAFGVTATDFRRLAPLVVVRFVCCVQPCECLCLTPGLTVCSREAALA